MPRHTTVLCVREGTEQVSHAQSQCSTLRALLFATLTLVKERAALRILYCSNICSTPALKRKLVWPGPHYWPSQAI